MAGLMKTTLSTQLDKKMLAYYRIILYQNHCKYILLQALNVIYN